MAKKTIWIDNDRPPTNYIWAKTDDHGNILGVYQYNGVDWVKIASQVGPSVEGDGTITAVTLEGETIQLNYSMSAISGTAVVRTDKGTILAKTPTGDDPQELITVEMLSWNYKQ